MLGYRRRREMAGALALACVVLALSGCRAPEPEEGGLSSDRFLDIVVAIRRAERAVQYGDSAAVEFERLKAEILAEHDVTDEDLRDYLARHDDLESLTEIWDTLNERLKHVPPGQDPTLEDADDDL